MIVQTFYMLADEITEGCKVGDIGSFSVCKHGKLLYDLRVDTDVIFTIVSTPATQIEKETSAYITLNNAIIQERQALTPSLIESIIDIDKEDIYIGNGILFKWAFEHRFRSTLLHYFNKYPTSRKYIDGLIYSYLDKVSYSDLIIDLIKRYNYDVKKDGNRLITSAAMCKNDYLCRWLIEEKDVLIPSTLYKIYMMHGSRFKDMWDLIQEHSDKVDLS